MITISAGHFGKGTGASGFIDEGEEAIYIVQQLEKNLRLKGIEVSMIIDKQSKNQQQNLAYIIKQHNATKRELDVSIHFNSTKNNQKQAIGTEVLYANPAISSLAQKLSTQIAKTGKLNNRGAKQRTNLAFLNGTAKKALLIEICFVNSEDDARLYKLHKEQIIEGIAQILANHLSPTKLYLSSLTLQQSIEAIFNDENYVRQQLEQGVEAGHFQSIWLENFKQGKLTLPDYLALTALQFKKSRN
ncbi:N-acetylmuramoyl-L-alanine amidase [Solibacillus silvestris]|uniref:N-acetylmuramoyl-L-alanine amidase n=1 Tax=Solibacillus silvestris TaxID=76853 RepID=UPI003F8029CD